MVNTTRGTKELNPNDGGAPVMESSLACINCILSVKSATLPDKAALASKTAWSLCFSSVTSGSTGLSSNVRTCAVKSVT